MKNTELQEPIMKLRMAVTEVCEQPDYLKHLSIESNP
jgi:hypothetical protein